MADDIVTNINYSLGKGQTVDDIATLLRTVVAVPHGVDIWTTTALEAADEIERLRAAGDVLAEWTAVDHSVEQCEDGCEYFAALRAWQEARRG